MLYDCAHNYILRSICQPRVLIYWEKILPSLMYQDHIKRSQTHLTAYQSGLLALNNMDFKSTLALETVENISRQTKKCTIAWVGTEGNGSSKTRRRRRKKQLLKIIIPSVKWIENIDRAILKVMETQILYCTPL